MIILLEYSESVVTTSQESENKDLKDISLEPSQTEDEDS